MSESLTTRVGRIIAGSFHAIVNAVENAAPEQVMEQAIREVDSAIAEVRADLGSVEAQRHLTAKRLGEDSARHDQLSEQAALAIRESREDLATAAIERQIDIEAQIPILESRLLELSEEKSRLEGYVTALLAKKREMRDALTEYHRLRERRMENPAPGSSATKDNAQTRVERATDAFERVFQRQAGLNATSGTSVQNAARLAELEELARKHRIEERLAQLKARP